MPTIGITSSGITQSNNSYQQPVALPVPTHRPLPPKDITATKPIIKHPVPATSNRVQINKYPREDHSGSSDEVLGQNIDVQW